MSEQEFKSYRFDDKAEPSDEMLNHLLNKAAHEVRESNRASDNSFFDMLRKVSAERRAEIRNSHL